MTMGWHIPARSARASLWGLVLAVAALMAWPARAELSAAAVASNEAVEAAGAPAWLDPMPGFDALIHVVAPAAAEALAGPLYSAEGAEIDRGKGSWYGGRFHGRRTASGEKFDMHDLTAAHKTLPFGTRVRVRDLDTGKEVVVRINDRGPHVRGRIIDLSRAAAVALGVLHAGEAAVALLLP
jgi:rare lipoprotein A